MALKGNLVAHWSLEAASGARADDIGGNSLTDTNTVTQATGIIGNAAQFVAANNEWLNIVDNAALSMGAGSFTIAAWVYLDVLGTTQTLMMKGSRGAAAIEYGIYIGGSNKAVFTIGNGTTNQLTGTTVLALTISTWALLIGWYDASGPTINIQLNNATPVSSAATITPQDGSAQFRLGAAADTSERLSGRIDEVAIWKRVLTTQERTDLYNGGAGLAFSSFSGTYTLSGSATPAAATGSGTGLTFDQFFTLSGTATPAPATGSGTGLVTTAPIYSLSGSASAGSATGSGIGLQFTVLPVSALLTLSDRARTTVTISDRLGP